MKFHFFAIICVLLLLISCDKTSEKESYTEIESSLVADAEGYLGDGSCTSCHEEELKVWQNSHHDLAMQELSAQTVLGNFDSIKASIDGVNYLFYRKGVDFHVHVKEIDGSTLIVTYTSDIGR